MGRLGGLVVIAPARRARYPGSNSGPGENFSLKLLIKCEWNINYKICRCRYFKEYSLIDDLQVLDC